MALDHFSHEHPLMLVEEARKEDDDEERRILNAVVTCVILTTGVVSPTIVPYAILVNSGFTKVVTHHPAPLTTVIMITRFSLTIFFHTTTEDLNTTAMSAEKGYIQAIGFIIVIDADTLSISSVLSQSQKGCSSI
ncbi:hypothetical protein LguiA_021437 [Lonicera macranthoides]